MVIYNNLGTWCCTTKENYYARIQNTRAIKRLEDFNSPEEIIAYYCKHFGSMPEDFTIIA